MAERVAEIGRVAVIGAGTMGAGIASHLSNAGVPVLLLDRASPDGDDRSAIARGAVARMREMQPPPLTHPDNADLITAGNVDDDLDRVGECDWIAEAVVERLDVKHAIYRELEKRCKPGAMISSNTSTIPLAMLTEGMPEARRRRFCITHFFNPVRYMRLLELVAGPETDPEVVRSLADFCDRKLGKGVVHCADRPGFLGNRVGVFALQVGIVEAAAAGIDVEEADALVGRPMGIPKTGVFGLYDLIGLDLMLDVAASLAGALPDTDAFQDVAGGLPLIRDLVAAGHSGNKGLGGFYREHEVDGERRREAVDLRSGEYRAVRKPSLDAALAGERGGLRALVQTDDRYGRYAWRVLARTLGYAASLVPEVTESIDPIDEAMRLGFNWAKGPFEMIDELGVAWFRERLRAEGLPVAPLLEAAGVGPLYLIEAGATTQRGLDGAYRPIDRPPGVLRLNELTATRKRLGGNHAASIWDLDDGVACVEFHTKANALHPESMQILREGAERAAAEFRALVVHTAAPHFSVGFNLEFVLGAIDEGDWEGLDRALDAFQQSCLALRYAPVPVVAAPAGLALGGGFEVVAHADAVHAHVNSVLGLVETIVGLVPGGGGCKEMLHRWVAASGGDPLAGALQAFRQIGTGRTSSSPEEARPMQLLAGLDRSTMSRDRQLPEAKAMALELASGYAPPPPPTFTAAGEPGREAMAEMLQGYVQRGVATPHDELTCTGLARVLSGGDVPAGAALAEQELLDLEREVFISLAHTEGTRARIAHMLATGKPLRN